jgi:hypothetical protein
MGIVWQVLIMVKHGEKGLREICPYQFTSLSELRRIKLQPSPPSPATWRQDYLPALLVIRVTHTGRSIPVITNAILVLLWEWFEKESVYQSEYAVPSTTTATVILSASRTHVQGKATFAAEQG